MQSLSNRIGTRAAMVAVGVATFIALHGSAGVSAQSEPQTPLTLYVCANPAGQPRFVAATEACRRNETRLTWKALGPSGPTGPIPDMVGTWRGDITGYGFANVADPTCKGSEALTRPQCQPQYFGSSPKSVMRDPLMNKKSLWAGSFHRLGDQGTGSKGRSPHPCQIAAT